MLKPFAFFLLAITLCTSCTREDEVAQLPLIDNVVLSKSILKVEVLAKDLTVPWDLAYADDGFLWFTEQSGGVYKINLKTAKKTKILTIENLYTVRTAGLLGLAIHPDFKRNPYLFLNYTIQRDSKIFNKLVKYQFKNDTLINPKLLLEIPGNKSHNGARLAITANGKLLWATGDAYSGESAQSLSSLNGKILRLNLDGSIPDDNPYPNSHVWANGFRNMQGLTVSDRGFVYTSEHGEAIEDEVNLIQKGGNYGWPAIEGLHSEPDELAFADMHKTIEPIKSWTPVIAPAGITYYNNNLIPEWKNSLLLTTLKGKSLRVISLNDDGTKVTAEEVLFENHYGRLRDVCTDAEGNVYVSTSNKDWNPQPGFPLAGDDRILKISRVDKASLNPLKAVKQQTSVVNESSAAQLYKSYCASCHQDNGKGIKALYPALDNSTMVNGDKAVLIKTMLKGINKENSAAVMPSFSFLTDKDLSKVLTYIRNNWSNKSGNVSVEEVKTNR